MGAKRVAVIAIVAAVVGSGAIYAVSPYFTESTINEPAPDIGMLAEMPAAPDTAGSGMAGGDETGDDPGGAAPVADVDTDAMTPVSYAGTFVGVGDGIHDAGGRAYTIPLEDGSTVLRLEDFYSTNGPGLRVYLATDTRASDYQSLGDLKANRGNQNYEIPDGVDLEKYNHVLIWCEPFSVLFGSAALGPR